MPAASLLEPIYKPICPLGDERFELRTRLLGCGCSTTTLLSIIVTIFGTIVGLLILYAIILCIRSINSVYGTGSRRGWEVEVLDDGSRRERQWARPSWTKSFASWFHRENLTSRGEQEEITERSRLLSAT